MQADYLDASLLPVRVRFLVQENTALIQSMVCVWLCLLCCTALLEAILLGRIPTRLFVLPRCLQAGLTKQPPPNQLQHLRLLERPDE